VCLGAGVWSSRMKVETSCHTDASNPDSRGMYEYYYEYELYRFSEGAVAFVACSYVHEPEAANLLRIEIDGSSRPLTVDDMRRPLLHHVLNYLRGTGKRRLTWLSGRGSGYEPVVFSAR
jgi:hypothetical protein